MTSEKTIMQPTWLKSLGLLLAMGCLASAGWAQQAPPTVKVRELPDVLRAQWTQTKPEMQSTSRCAAAFDSYSDPDRMIFKCSVYIKLTAEGVRRAMRYCEEEREKKHIHAPCRIVLEE